MITINYIFYEICLPRNYKRDIFVILIDKINHRSVVWGLISIRKDGKYRGTSLNTVQKQTKIT